MRGSTQWTGHRRTWPSGADLGDCSTQMHAESCDSRDPPPPKSPEQAQEASWQLQKLGLDPERVRVSPHLPPTPWWAVVLHPCVSCMCPPDDTGRDPGRRPSGCPTSPDELPLAPFSNKRKRLEYWSPGTENQAVISHLFCAFLSCKHFPFSQADKFAFPRN